jgi:hypothetical protein
MDSRNKNRLVLLLVVALFALPLGAAFFLRASDWRPQRTNNSGTLVDPPRDMTNATLTLADGSKYTWSDPQYRWTLLALPGDHCAAKCLERLDEVLRMRITLGRNADRLRIVYIGPALPDQGTPERASMLIARDEGAAFVGDHAHGDDNLALALVDPNGRLMLRYPDGYSAQGLRGDIVRIIY